MTGSLEAMILVDARDGVFPMSRSASLALLIPTCLALSGCAAHRPRDASTPADAVGYTLTLAPGPPAAVRVTLQARGEPDGTSRFVIAPSWGGVENCERFVHDPAVHDAAGRECPVTTDPGAPHGWNVAHEPGATLIATYELRPATPDALAQFHTHYEPVVRDDLLHLIGETGLIYPEWLEDSGPIDIRLTWSGFEARGWTVVSSFDADGGRVRMPLPEFRHAMFLAGRVRVHDRDIGGTARGRLRVAIYGDDWGFTDPELVDLVERIVTVEREFVNDFADPYFLVTVVPTGPRATPRSVSQGGTGLTNCFALFLAPGTAIGPDSQHRNHVLRLLAHEYFHTWNGGEIVTEEPEEYVYWFSEGFTDFYASRLLRRAGLIDDAEWTSRLNETLKRLWLNPAATEPAETIRRDFWSRREIHDLPYNRGEVVALMLDEEIRRVSGGKRSLDDFFLEVLSDARPPAGQKAETGRLLARVARWTSPEFAESLRRIVVDGAMPDPPAHLTEPAATRADVDSFRYDTGFDLDGALQSKVAAGVREGSAAHAAGLRDGQPITGFSVYHADPDREITLNVKEDGEARSITFYPRGAPVRIPRYQSAAPGG